MSGNCNTKSITPEILPDLLAPALIKKGVYFLHFGGNGELKADHEKIISLQGALNWEQVFCMMSLCSAAVCIDSSILHIAQHLNLPSLSMWGPTKVCNIFGVHHGLNAIEIPLDCTGCNRYECNHKNCMSSMNKAEFQGQLEIVMKG